MESHGAAETVEILLVEDNPGDIRLTRMALQQGQIPKKIRVAEDGETAMAYLRQQGEFAGAPRPDLIVLDLNLPRKSGYEVLEEIKSDDVLRAIPTVILTTTDQYGDIRRCYELMANCFVTKPVGLDHYIQAVRAIEEFWLRTASLPSAAVQV